MPFDMLDPGAGEETLNQDPKLLSASIISASRQGDLERVVSLVDQWESDISQPGPKAEDLRAALSWAAQKSHPTVVQYLLKHGAQIDADVMTLATYGNSPTVWQVFLDHGWDINSPCGTNAPVLKHLVGDESLVRWFLDNGADPNVHGSKNECPLDTAAAGCHFGSVQLLLEHGAKLDHSNALHAAAVSREDDSACIQMMVYLLDHGADINALEHQGNPQYRERRKGHAFGTALHSAAQKGKKERVRFLLEKGADPSVLNSKGIDVAGWVTENDEERVAELLNKYEADLK